MEEGQVLAPGREMSQIKRARGLPPLRKKYPRVGGLGAWPQWGNTPEEGGYEKNST